jgi:hypothetical protein
MFLIKLTFGLIGIAFNCNNFWWSNEKKTKLNPVFDLNLHPIFVFLENLWFILAGCAYCK